MIRHRAIFAVLLLSLSGCATTAPILLPAATSVPPAGSGLTTFGEYFCATLTHLDPLHTEWGACERYLRASVSPQAAVTTPITSDWQVLVVGGIFSHCFEQRHAYVLAPALNHLEVAHGIKTHLLSVGSVDTPEANAAVIARYLESHPGRYIAVGHSKGAVDLMTALQHYKTAQDNIHALVSVAGAIGGSPLLDVSEGITIAGFRWAVRNSGLGDCRIERGGGIKALRREARQAFLREWKPPAGLRSYSVVGVVDRHTISAPLRTMWTMLKGHARDNDSQVIPIDGVIPGARFLGVANGDHWALAVPFSEHYDPRVRRKVDRNRFPRTALLEAIVRYVDSGA